MTVNLFTFVDLYSRALTTLSHILTKGAEHAKAQGVGEKEMLDWRLIDDMQPLRFQISVVCNFSRQWTARVAGLPVPADIVESFSLDALQAEIAAAKAYLAALKPEQFAGRDDVPLKVLIGGSMEPTLPAGQWLTVLPPPISISICRQLTESCGPRVFRLARSICSPAVSKPAAPAHRSAP